MEFDGNVQRILLRTIDGDVAILARHIKYCTGIGMGTAHIVMEDGTERKAACIGGMISMMDNECRVFPTTWEWSDEIDLERAEEAKKVAEERLANQSMSSEAISRAEAKLSRALVRISTARGKY
jgi:F-type H+-transporting ATPase subunit epsilon